MGGTENMQEEIKPKNILVSLKRIKNILYL
jgi:hypothetical protein